MLTTTLSFDNMHTYGDLFTTLLRARKLSSNAENKWDMPEADGMEFDQYDSPASRWIAVHEQGEVLAGIRLTPTTAKCGIYSYMIRDAQRGLLNSLPSNLLDFDAPTTPHIWEASRMFVSKNVPKNDRTHVQAKLIDEVIQAARTIGATQIIGLMPAEWPDKVARLGLDVAPAGPKIIVDGVDTQAALMMLATNLH